MARALEMDTAETSTFMCSRKFAEIMGQKPWH